MRAPQVGLAGALKVTDEGRVDGEQITGVVGLDMAFAEFQADAFRDLDLLLDRVKG
jgi:hypothetical protein